jgi:hypothetical protein
LSDSAAIVRNILMHIAAGVLVHETPPAAEALLVDDLAETLADLLRECSTGGEPPAEHGGAA